MTTGDGQAAFRLPTSLLADWETIAALVEVVTGYPVADDALVRVDVISTDGVARKDLTIGSASRLARQGVIPESADITVDVPSLRRRAGMRICPRRQGQSRMWIECDEPDLALGLKIRCRNILSIRRGLGARIRRSLTNGWVIGVGSGLILLLLIWIAQVVG